MLDANGHKGATACVVIPDFGDRHQQEGDWRILAEWIDANLPYATLEFSRLCGRSTSSGTNNRSDG
jgi:hypothetical protein